MVPRFSKKLFDRFLQFLSNKTNLYNPIIPIIEETLRNRKISTIIDLGSGGGGGLVRLNEELKKNVPELNIIMTDYFPNIIAFEHTKKLSPNFSYEKNPVDARNVPANLKGLRTQFLSFHHFKPAEAKLILQHALDSKSPIAIFEAQERSLSSIIAMLLSPVSVFLTSPFIRPFKIGRIVFTYLIPIVPLIVLWDGIISSLRTYSVKEMNELIQSLNKHEIYDWQVGKINSGPSKILYLIGHEKE